MNRKSYIKIIIDTFWETRAPILSEIAEPLLDFRKTLFLTELRRKQKIAERDFFVTLKDFEMQCCLAIDELTETIGTKVFRDIQVWADKNIYLNADYNWKRNGHGYTLPEFEAVLKLEVECEDTRYLNVDLNILYPYLRGYVCGWDIEFLEWVIEDLNLATDQQPIYEPLDLSDTSAVQKVIFLKELGIIELLQKNPCFTGSVRNLCSVLSAITGVKVNSLTPMLNPMLNDRNLQKNNPYNSKLTVEKVNSQLIALGFQPK